MLGSRSTPLKIQAQYQSPEFHGWFPQVHRSQDKGVDWLCTAEQTGGLKCAPTLSEVFRECALLDEAGSLGCMFRPSLAYM